jgi:hypothetical membrane protein
MKHINTKSNRITKIAGLCGILLPAIVFVCIGFAISHSPWFKWTHNALSDLGVEGISALFFNSGMVFGGILALLFSIGLMKTLSNKIGAYTLGLSAVALIGIGVFPENINLPHFIASAAFFILVTLSLIILAMTIKKDKFEKNMAGLATIFAMIALSSGLLLLPFEGIAIPESIVCFPAFIWCMIYGLKMTFFTEQLSETSYD